MTHPSGEYPQAGHSPEIEALRNSCARHGQYYADKLALDQRVVPLMTGDLSDEQFYEVLEADPALDRAYNKMTVLQDLYDTVGHPQQGVGHILSQGKASLINPYAESLSDQVIERLGEKPDFLDVELSMFMFASQAALVNRRLQRPAEGRFQNIVVNQFANIMLAKADTNTLCASFSNGDQSAFLERARTKVAEFSTRMKAITGQDIGEDYLLAKMGSLHHSLANTLRMQDLMKTMPEVEATDAEVKEMERHNSAFAKHILRIRNHGVKSVLFSFEDVVPGMDAIYHHPRMLGITLQGDQPLALVQLASAEISAETKLDKTVEKENLLSDDLTRVTLGVGVVLISIDSKGELYNGANSVNGVPLRTCFEQQQALGKYEILRGELLARLFDAVAPATIVNRIEAEATEEEATNPQPVVPPQQGQTTRKPAENVINRAVLPRLRYMNSHNAKAIKKDFEEALKTETQELAQAQKIIPTAALTHGRKLHEVEGFKRLLPKHSKGPGKKAIENAKLYYGDDYELPPGYTFVKTHERGDETYGVVTGYIATRRTVAIEDQE